MEKFFYQNGDKAEVLNIQLQSVFNNNFSINRYFKSDNMGNTLCDFTITGSEVFNQLSKLDCNKSNGPDGIPSKVLKSCARQLAKPLTDNLSIRLGSLPDDWTANIVPIFKKGDKSNPANYRPVSLQSIICKILERIINKRLVNYLDENCVITEYQHGFRLKRSCETQLLCSLHDWCQTLDAGCSLDVV